MMDDSMRTQAPDQWYLYLGCGLSDGEWVVVVSSDGLRLLGSSLLYSVVYCVPICGIRIAQVVSLVMNHNLKGVLYSWGACDIIVAL